MKQQRRVVAHAEFQQKSTRYISGLDFQKKYLLLFGSVSEAAIKKDSLVGGITFINGCISSSQPWGHNNPATGLPTTLAPNGSTVNAINSCLDSTFNELVYSPDTYTGEEFNSFLKYLIHPQIVQKYLKSGPNKLFWETKISDMTDEEKDLFISYLLENTLGTDEIIKSYGIIIDVQAFRTSLLNKIKYYPLGSAFATLTKELFLRDEFLTY